MLHDMYKKRKTFYKCPKTGVEFTEFQYNQLKNFTMFPNSGKEEQARKYASSFVVLPQRVNKFLY